MRLAPLLRALLVAPAVMAACVAGNPPINPPLDEGQNEGPRVVPDHAHDDIFVGLALSGGGHRASAFAYGILSELRATGVTPRAPEGLAGDVRFITAVSGGAVLAAWFGLEGPDGLDAFRERYLLGDGERYMTLSPLAFGAPDGALRGGLNARDSFGRWLDESLLGGRTFGDLTQAGGAEVAIAATDVAAASAFVFNPDTFDALCADLARLPLSEAIAASAAVPVVFSPILIRAHPRTCGYEEPVRLRAARLDPGAHPAARAYAEAQARYADGTRIAEVRLLDGGIADTFGLAGLLAERLREGTPHAPMTAEEAVRVRRVLFLAVDATMQGQDPLVQALEPAAQLLGLSLAGLSQRIANPGDDLDPRLAYEAITAAERHGFETLEGALEAWRRDLVRYRCALPEAEVARLRGTAEGWDCEDLRFFVGLVEAERLPERLRDAVDAVPTRLRLDPDVVDMVATAGRLATRATPAYAEFLASLAP